MFRDIDYKLVFYLLPKSKCYLSIIRTEHCFFYFLCTFYFFFSGIYGFNRSSKFFEKSFPVNSVFVNSTGCYNSVESYWNNDPGSSLFLFRLYFVLATNRMWYGVPGGAGCFVVVVNNQNSWYNCYGNFLQSRDTWFSMEQKSKLKVNEEGNGKAWIKREL